MDVSGVTADKISTANTVANSTPAVKHSAPEHIPAETEQSVLSPAIHEAAADKSEKEQGMIPQDSLDKALEKINKSLTSFNREMEISVHSKLNRIMVKVMDTEQNKVIREIPPEKVLDAFAKALEMAGVLLDVKQ